MSRVSAQGRGALQGLRSPDGDSMHLEEAFAQIEGEFAPPATRSPIELRVAVEGRSRPLHPVFRDEVYCLGREAIVNAFRHSGARTIEVEIEYSRKQFSLIVSDDGCGIDPQVLRSGREGHWGLPGMRERSERVGGKLRVLSRLGSGTRVEVLAPGKVAFQLPQQRDPSQSSDLFWRWGRLKFLRRPAWLLFDTQKVVPEDSDKR
jgi:signal transduction histidine kinase